MVRPLPHGRSSGGGIGEGVRWQSSYRQGQRGQQSADRHEVRHPQHPHDPVHQERRGGGPQCGCSAQEPIEPEAGRAVGLIEDGRKVKARDQPGLSSFS